MAVRRRARSEAEKIYHIGTLEPVPAAQNAANLDGLRKGLRDLGSSKGETWSSNIGQPMVGPSGSRNLASELVGLKVDLILTRGTPATTAVQNATGAIPVVMVTMGGPGAIVASFARPAGNIRG